MLFCSNNSNIKVVASLGLLGLIVNNYLFCLGASVSDDKSFYELLGVAQDADDRAIRRAFKKLALKYHPDKNKDDPDAHSTFVRMNRAYEVLKDDELRKKYDLFGEEGLKDEHQGRGQGYQSYSFYRDNFGIYDEDVEVVTLSQTDFDQSVLNSGDQWFVNFYSTGCSHCHQLAPAWRLLARELDGVIRIGAVNCQDSWALCQQQGVHSYPSLYFFPQREKYQGSRTKEDLLNFVLKRLTAKPFKLNEAAWKTALASEDSAGKPWLINFCDQTEDCLSDLTRKKVASILQGLAIVGSVDCVKEPKFCKSFDAQSGVYFYDKEDSLATRRGRKMESYDAKELSYSVLELLPDAEELDEKSFKKILKGTQSEPWLVEFTDGSKERNIQLRKLPALLADTKIGKLDCRKFASTCKDSFIRKFPAFAIFKPSGGYEIHHGRADAHDVAAFVKDAVTSPLRVLGPDEFNGAVKSSDETWFIDFFTPWCPPCMRLLPLFRQTAKMMGDSMHFGSVDCTIHNSLCQAANVHSFPTTILYNYSEPHSFVGLHSVDELIDFIEDIRNPPVISLSPQTFAASVTQRPDGAIWLVDFFAPWCGPCQQLAPEWRKLAKVFRDSNFVSVGHVDCVKYPGLCRENGVSSYPTIRMYLADGSQFVDYNGWFRDLFNIRQWVQQWLPSAVDPIGATQFLEEVLTSEAPWVVDFYANWCGHCHQFAPIYEEIANLLEQEGVMFAKIDCEQHRFACQQAGIRAYPTLKFYPGAQDSQIAQDAYGLEVGSLARNEVIAFIRKQLATINKDRESKSPTSQSRDHDEF